MLIKEEMWKHIPLLHIVEERYEKKNVPVVLFLHGFTSAKEHNLHYAYNLAKKGVRVLLPDAHLHGARSEQLDEIELALRFWEIVMTSIEEVKILQDELKIRNLVDQEKVALGGTSMGGITTLGSLAIYDWIDASIVMMGSPGFVELSKAQMAEFVNRGFKLPVTEEEKNQLLDQLSLFDLTKNPSALNKRPVYFWHGKKDPVVPYAPTYQFYEEVKEMYANRPNDFIFRADAGAGHAVTRVGMLEAIDWLASQLNE